MLSVVDADCHLRRVSHKKAPYAECRYAECHYAQCRGAICGSRSLGNTRSTVWAHCHSVN
jgi:hypothetical protein